MKIMANEALKLSRQYEAEDCRKIAKFPER